jgi:G3E family GTPase
MVNDFGSVNIDANLIVAVEGERISLTGDCICCAIRGDLLASALQLLGRRHPPEYLGPDCDHEHQHDHGAAFSTWSYTTAQPLGLKALRQVVLELPAAIFRAMGLIYLADVPHRAAVRQAVGPRASVTLGEPWGDEAPRTQLVFPSTPGDLDEAALQAAFDRCRTEPSLEQAVAAQQTWMRGENA